jgi:O-methyltransferase
MSVKTLVKRTLRTVGYDIFSVPKSAQETRSGYAYSLIQPQATLSPWLADADFMRAHATVQDHTLVDIYRLFELWSLVGETAKIGGDIVEIGVWRGGSGCLMAHREQLLGGNGIVNLCDTFQGVVKAGKEDTGYRGGEHKDTGTSYVDRLKSDFGLKNTKTLVGIFPDETAAQLASQRVRLLHIDVDVYQSAKDSVEFLWDRMPSGAVIVFDDYGFVGCEGVTRYVDELKASKEVIYLHNLNGHAVVIKR